MANIRIPVETARKWHNLAERRRAHLLKLEQTGRWKYFYSDQSFQAQMREANAEVGKWSELMLEK
jgi:hypothetical protein